jgi:hypothetical protein
MTKTCEINPPVIHTEPCTLLPIADDGWTVKELGKTYKVLSVALWRSGRDNKTDSERIQERMGQEG